MFLWVRWLQTLQVNPMIIFSVPTEGTAEEDRLRAGKKSLSLCSLRELRADIVMVRVDSLRERAQRRVGRMLSLLALSKRRARSIVSCPTILSTDTWYKGKGGPWSRSLTFSAIHFSPAWHPVCPFGVGDSLAVQKGLLFKEHSASDRPLYEGDDLMATNVSVGEDNACTKKEN